MMISDSAQKSISKTLGFLPQEEMLEVTRRDAQLYIGIPKETSFQENRIGIVPESVALLINNGHQVIIESGAGVSANFTDNEYSEAGAKIVYSTKEVYEADIILKITPPSLEEVKMMKNKQILISALHLSIQNKEYFEILFKKDITALGFELIKEERTDTYPILRSMSEIAGNTSILLAAEYLSNINYGKGLMLGGVSGVTPTEIVILGAGTVGEFAARSAIGLGASVKVFDDSLERLRLLQNNLGQRIFTSIFQPKVLQKALMRCDVAIGAFYNSSKRTPCLVSEEMVKQMKSGSVIIDVSIDKGGCFETSHITSHSDPTYKKYDVIHYCVPNINSRVSRTASYALSNILTPILLRVASAGGLNELLQNDSGIRKGTYLFNGLLTNQFIGELYNLPYKDLNLLITAF